MDMLGGGGGGGCSQSVVCLAPSIWPPLSYFLTKLWQERVWSLKSKGLGFVLHVR